MLCEIKQFQCLLFNMLVIGFITAANTFGDSADDWAQMKLISPESYVCGFTDTPIQVDGKITDAAWDAAPWTNSFRDIEGDVKSRPFHLTRAKMLWDEEFFYIAAMLEEPHVWGTLKKHDSVIFHDNDFEVFIDPDGDNHQYYELELNALNTTWDLFLPKPYKDGGKADNSWEIPGLKTAVHVQGSLNDPSDEDIGWSVEIAIPWKVLGEYAHRAAPPSDGDHWRVNFSRVQWKHQVVDKKYQKVPNTRENNWVWSPQGIIDMHRPERWGYVQFSKEQAGQTGNVPDHVLSSRDALMEIYHHQKSFYRKHKRWAASLSELQLQDQQETRASAIHLRLTPDGYQASLEVPQADGPSQVWYVRQDSKLWLDQDQVAIETNLERSGENRAELERALRRVPREQLAAMRFLIANMPDRDLLSLKADFLLENVKLAYQARQRFSFAREVPHEIFLNDVLPYASINERRDNWRYQFLERFGSIVQETSSISEAAALLNQKIFPELQVRYSTKRRRADQSPLESMKSGLASCTGLSVLLIDACRAVGIPARFVGTPLWSDQSGNHSWVEIWDQTWHFTGAAEPRGLELDKAWFLGRASAARRDHPLHAIYAVSFRKTPQTFPMVWARQDQSVSAVNVTDRYANRMPMPPEGSKLIRFVVRDRGTGQRRAVELRLFDTDSKEVFRAKTNDERFDANDHISTVLPIGNEYNVELRWDQRILKSAIKIEDQDQPHVFFIQDAQPTRETTSGQDNSKSESIGKLRNHLSTPRNQRESIAGQDFAAVALRREDAELAKRLLWKDHADRIRQERAEEMKKRRINLGDLTMPFTYQIFGEKPTGGRSLYISMHGGGGAPKRVNDQQWENQKRLYRLDEGVYLVPRAPTDTWNLWHQAHIDQFFSRLIENLIVFEQVNPNRVYLMGYSAGGDGVYQLAPRMADQLAAASMMAGHPNETSPLGLRNLPFTIHMGELDSAYKRNATARQWGEKLGELRKQDAGGYLHEVTLHRGKGHWMDRQDAVAIQWMAKFNRNTFPRRIIWKQDDVVHNRFYWLAGSPQDMRGRAEVQAEVDGQIVNLMSDDADRLTIRLSDQLLDLDEPITVRMGDRTLYQGVTPRTIAVIAKTLAERGDPEMLFTSEVTVQLLPKNE